MGNNLSNVNNQSNNNIERQRLYEDFVNSANNRIKSNQEAQDKMILTISAALFGLLPFLLDKLQAGCLAKCCIVILLLSNTISLMSVLLSFFFCAKGNEEDIKYAEEYYLHNKEDSLNKKSCWTRIGVCCNNASLISFGISLVIFTIILGVYFFTKENYMNDKLQEQTEYMNGFSSAEMKKMTLSQEGYTTPIMKKINNTPPSSTYSQQNTQSNIITNTTQTQTSKQTDK